MLNNDTLIKYSRNRGHKTDWPDKVNYMRLRLDEIKLGFPGIRNDHLSLVEWKDIVEGDIFIYDSNIEDKVRPTEAPIMFRKLPENNLYIEGIGCGLDLERDPYRLKYRWKDTIKSPGFSDNQLVYRVDVRPTINGGPGYYYFFKSYRDFRM